MMKRLGIGLMLVAGTAWGQVDTNIWPAWQHPRSGEAQVWQCWSGVTERVKVGDDVAYVARTSLPAPTWYRSARSTLINCKSAIKSVIPRFSTDQREPSELLTVLNAITNAPNSDSDFNYIVTNWTAQALLASARLPTNYFEYTPYRTLSGLGPYTNDATVGHPHGWVTTETSAGGTNFPAGRTNWYTSDYGFDGIIAIVTNLNRILTWQEYTSGQHTKYDNTTAPSGDPDLGDAYYQTWNDVLNNLTVVVTNAPINNNTGICRSYGNGFYSAYYGKWAWRGDRHSDSYAAAGLHSGGTYGTNAAYCVLFRSTNPAPPDTYRRSIYDSFGRNQNEIGSWPNATNATYRGWQIASNNAAADVFWWDYGFGVSQQVARSFIEIGLTNYTAVTMPTEEEVGTNNMDVYRGNYGYGGTKLVILDFRNVFKFK